MVRFVKKSTCSSRQNTVVSAAILCSAMGVGDVINKLSVSGRSIKYVMSQLFFFFFLLFVGKEQTERQGAPRGTQIRNKQDFGRINECNK